MKLKTNTNTNLVQKGFNSPDMEMIGVSAMPVELTHTLTRYQRDKLIRISVNKISQEKRCARGPNMLRLVAAQQFLELVHLKPEFGMPSASALVLDSEDGSISVGTNCSKLLTRPERGEIKKPETISAQPAESDEDTIPLGISVNSKPNLPSAEKQPRTFHKKSKSFSGLPSKPLIEVSLPCPPALLMGDNENVAPLPEMNFSLLKFVKFQRRRL